MVVVKVKPGESQDKLILRFRKRVVQSGLLWELRDRERHKTAAERRKEKKYAIEHLREVEKSKVV